MPCAADRNLQHSLTAKVGRLAVGRTVAAGSLAGLVVTVASLAASVAAPRVGAAGAAEPLEQVVGSSAMVVELLAEVGGVTAERVAHAAH